MTGVPVGGTPPLDLAVLAAALAKPGAVRDGLSRAWIVQLLALLRETRVALEEFLTPDFPGSQRYKRAKAVLGRAVDDG